MGTYQKVFESFVRFIRLNIYSRKCSWFNFHKILLIRTYVMKTKIKTYKPIQIVYVECNTFSQVFTGNDIKYSKYLSKSNVKTINHSIEVVRYYRYRYSIFSKEVYFFQTNCTRPFRLYWLETISFPRQIMVLFNKYTPFESLFLVRYATAIKYFQFGSISRI